MAVDGFRFETLLKLRKQREDERKRLVASRLRGISHLEIRRVKLLDQIDEQNTAMRQVLQGEVDMDDVRLGRHWLIRLRRGVLETDAEIATQRAILAQERIHLAEAAKQTKILQKLKERKNERLLAERIRQEQVATDEINIMRFANPTLAERDGA